MVLRKHFTGAKILAIVGIVVVLSLVTALAASADAPAAPAGVNPETAVPITGGSATLQPGGVTWYGFQYAGDGSQIQVILNEQGQSGLAFGVWTPDLVKQWEAGNAVSPIGMGTANADVPGADLFWTGNFNLPTTYFVKVENDGTTPLSYTLSINGSGVAALPGAPAAPVAAPAAPAAANPAPAPAAPPKGGVNSETALTANGAATTIQPGQSVWYGFNYAGDGSQVQVILNEQGQSGLTFGVWTPDEIQQYEAGNVVSPIGMGTPNSFVPGGDLYWTGNFNIPARYFVMVTNTSSTPMSYMLTITGSGVQ